jgi:hypothetical protein
VAELDEEYIRRMEDILAVYEKPLSAREPVVCADEKPVVLHQEIRPPQAMRPGRVARRDGEYQRCGTANVFCGVQPQAGRYFPEVTDSRSSPEFADYLLEVAHPLPGGGHHPFGVGQSEFAYPQGGGGTLWRESRRLVVESVYRALHPQARQLAKPSRNRDQPVFPAMPGPTPHRRPRFSVARNSGLGPSHESPLNSDSMVLYSQEGSAYL